MARLEPCGQSDPALDKAAAALEGALDKMNLAYSAAIEARRDDLVVRIDGAYGLVANVVREVIAREALSLSSGGDEP